MFNINLNTLIGKKTPSTMEIGINPENDLSILLYECSKHLKTFNEERIKKAFVLCCESHKNKLRKSGLPYYTHPLQVARIVINEIPLDDISIISALLHDVLDEGEKVTINDIEIEFGKDVATIVEGIYKIAHIESKNIDSESQIENYRKLLLSLFKDVRIILIKLADRLHNMRTVDYLPESSRLKLARETLDVYAPFANRFGLRNIKWELEDLSFKEINRQSYDDIKSALNSTREEREEYIQNFITPIEEKLNNDGLLKRLRIKHSIKGRPKNIYSIFNKMKARKKNIDELYDLFAVRIILETDDPNICFYCYGLVASIYPPVPETFKDYINSSKRNGYQSIHTAVVGIKKKIVEVQFRTRAMHEFAEEGFAAHFRYKGGKVDPNSILERKQINDWITTVREIFENVGLNTSEELLDSVKKNLLFDEIYVYTPKNEFRTLPKDSTPLDFAFDIHSEIGYHYVGAKVNSKIAPIDYKLESGDQIEILTSKNQTPKADWLRYVVTNRAKIAINKYLKEEERNYEQKGMKLWEEKCKEFDIYVNSETFEQLIKSMKFAEKKDFYIALSTAKFDINKAIEFIKYKLEYGLKFDNIEKTNEKTVEQHKKKLTKVLNLKDESFTKLHDGKLLTYIIITAKYGPQTLDSINAALVSTKNIGLLSIKFKIEDNNFVETIKLKLSDKSIVDQLLENIFVVKGIIKVEFFKNIIEE
ncbi:MAG TPA: RelA/SpoT family protein [Candidatus Kapabacteria bacterium]|nr:RelA/SpoT family protein [Candidatus Kapabacteria bacterium]